MLTRCRDADAMSAGGQARGAVMDRSRQWTTRQTIGSNQWTSSTRGIRSLGRRLHALLLSVLMLLAGAVVAVATSGSAHAATLPAGFQESIAFSGLTNPTVVRLSPDGRIFVAEKSGVIAASSESTQPLAPPYPTTR
jgi:hypothetical protein